MQSFQYRSVLASLLLTACALASYAVLVPSAYAQVVGPTKSQIQTQTRTQMLNGGTPNLDASLAKVEGFFEGPQLQHTLSRLTQGLELNALLGAVEQVVSAEVQGALRAAAEGAGAPVLQSEATAVVPNALSNTMPNASAGQHTKGQTNEAQALIQSQALLFERNVHAVVREAAPVVLSVFAEVLSGVFAETKRELQQTWVREVLFK